ncbi:hypothetical protein Bhyg_11210 [Pseudolycoriella hygida]|uniref:Uncharacterized protein n=1 Tax=Pseudolycoriella hygida TaxID=35572 RepID=A0A9Q0RY48_9DIPT|nr:hypothetical protein Bhyg_11210 [Pseudolycoriella hygida]
MGVKEKLAISEIKTWHYDVIRLIEIQFKMLIFRVIKSIDLIGTVYLKPLESVDGFQRLSYSPILWIWNPWCFQHFSAAVILISDDEVTKSEKKKLNSFLKKVFVERSGVILNIESVVGGFYSKKIEHFDKFHCFSVLKFSTGLKFYKKRKVFLVSPIPMEFVSSEVFNGFNAKLSSRIKKICLDLVKKPTIFSDVPKVQKLIMFVYLLKKIEGGTRTLESFPFDLKKQQKPNDANRIVLLINNNIFFTI